MEEQKECAPRHHVLYFSWEVGSFGVQISDCEMKQNPRLFSYPLKTFKFSLQIPKSALEAKISPKSCLSRHWSMACDTYSNQSYAEEL